jgi:hypothetical protein
VRFSGNLLILLEERCRVVVMAGEDVPKNAHIAVTEKKTGVEEKNGVDEKNEGVVTVEEETKKPFIGKRKNEQEAQVNSGKQKGQLPKKRFYRAQAHSNPLSDCQFSI